MSQVFLKYLAHIFLYVNKLNVQINNLFEL